MQASPIFEAFSLAAAAHPARTALISGGRTSSYADLLRDANALAAGLASLGIGAGDHLGVLLPNCREFVLLLLAAARTGAVLVPQSMGLGGEAVCGTFRAAGVRHVVAWSAAAAARAAADALPAQAARVSVGARLPGWTALEDLLALDAPATAPPALAADHPYLMVLTSGSTGAPKPILLSQHTKHMRAVSAIELYSVTDADVTLACTPLYHSLAQRLVLIPLLTGGTSVLMEHFTPRGWVETVRSHAVSFSIAVSSQLRQLLAQFDPAQPRLESLRCLVSSSALLDKATKTALFDRLRCEFHECYGTSEIAIATDLSPTDAECSLGSVGRAIPGAQVRIIDPQGRPAAPGTPGEIVCRTRLLYSGYYSLPDATADAMWGEYFRTGDLGRMDEEGYLYFLGRIKDIIISGGVNVYPKDIEDVVAAHAQVRECAAIPVADEALGEVVGLVVAAVDPAAPPTLREIQRLCMDRLGDHQQPRHFHFIDELPKNAMGKIDKLSLRKRYSSPAEPA